MNRAPLFVTIAGLLFASTTTHADEVTTHSLQNGAIERPDFGLIHLDQLGQLLETGTAGLAPIPERDDVIQTTPHPGQQIMGWVNDVALLDQGVSDSIGELFHSGVPVLVITEPHLLQDGVQDGARSLFGVSLPARHVTYKRTRDGSVHAIALDDDTTLPTADPDDGNAAPEADDAVAQDMEYAAQVLTERLKQIDLAATDRNTALASRSEATRIRRSLDTGRSSRQNTADIAWAPRMEFVGHTLSTHKGGNSATYRVVVSRDTTPSKDTFKVFAELDYALIPFASGYRTYNYKNRYTVHDLTYPLAYRITQSASLSGGTRLGRGAVTLIDHAPKASGTTDLSVDETKTRSTSYGFTAGVEVSAGLAGKVPNAGAKGAFSLNWSRTNTESSSIKYTTPDYILLTGIDRGTIHLTHEASGPTRARMVDAISKRNPENSLTPAMKRLAPRHVAVWEVPADETASLLVEMRSSIDMMSSSTDMIRLRRRQLTHGRTDKFADTGKQPSLALRINLNSPFLAKEVVSLIHSRQGNGGCLWDRAGVVKLQPCPSAAQAVTPHAASAHWQMDSHGRYYNRGSKRCIALPSPSNASNQELITESCALTNAQRWVWYADRIHSQYSGGDNGWRMYVDQKGAVRAKHPSTLFDDIPVNSSHPLLPPWSTYPSKPTAGVTVPVLGGVQPIIPSDWTMLHAVGASQRWDVTPLRTGLSR